MCKNAQIGDSYVTPKSCSADALPILVMQQGNLSPGSSTPQFKDPSAFCKRLFLRSFDVFAFILYIICTFFPFILSRSCCAGKYPLLRISKRGSKDDPGTSPSWPRGLFLQQASPVQYASVDPSSLELSIAHHLSQVLFGSGDALAQQAVDRRGLAKHDFARTGRMALYGGGMFCQFPALRLIHC